MRLLLVQLSDIHFRTTSNPVAARVPQIAAAIRSTGATPDACVILITGDIACSGQDAEYEIASTFFSDLRRELEHDLPGTSLEFLVIPGNHDCFLPTEKIELRKVVVAAAAQLAPGAPADPGISADLLLAQDGFFKFLSALAQTPTTWQDKLRSHRSFSFCGKVIRFNLFNTAFLSQRKEQPTLSIPPTLLESILPDSAADLTIALHHHAEGWLEPTFKRSFRKLIETTSDIVFTGHEHQSDYHLTQNIEGNNLTYVEGDALQEIDHPGQSGFNCLLLDFAEHKQFYFLFRWKADRYTAIVDGAEHPLRVILKGGSYFQFDERYQKRLIEDDFGFRHANKAVLLLEDIFVYPSATKPNRKGQQDTILGDHLLDHVLKARHVVFYGPDLSGKTALLKVLQRDIFSSTAIIPVKLEGSEITAQSEDALLKIIWSHVAEQYTADCVEGFRQLPRERRALLIDNLDDSPLRPDKLCLLLESAKKHFTVIVASVRTILGSLHLYGPKNGEAPDSVPLLQLLIIGEMRPSGRGNLIKKWLSVDSELASDREALSRAIAAEENTIDYLIGKKVLPSLPYLVLGILQARQRGKDDLSDPGAFGYIVQRIVIDALSATKGKKAMIERKDYLLRKVALYLFQHEQRELSEREFESVVTEFAKSKMINADGNELLADLLHGRILEMTDGHIRFKYEHFQWYFLALQFIDEIDGENAEKIRGYLNDMADKPLVKAHRLTLIFFLFFRKRDPIIDRLIQQANATFSGRPEADLLPQQQDGSDGSLAFVEASVDEDVDVNAERERRWSEEDKSEQQTSEARSWDGGGQGGKAADGASLEIAYEEAKSDEERWGFADARLSMLGQIIRNFPDSLDGARKVQILEAAIRLGLRDLQAGLDMIREWDTRIADLIRRAAAAQGTTQAEEAVVEHLVKLWQILIGVLRRYGCYLSLVDISRAVGVQDLEDAYSTAITRIGETPATKLVELSIMLDHGKTFPFIEAQRLKKFLPSDAHLALAVMSDLIVRHTKRFDYKRETLRRIAGLINVKPTSLLSSGDTL